VGFFVDQQKYTKEGKGVLS